MHQILYTDCWGRCTRYDFYRGVFYKVLLNGHCTRFRYTECACVGSVLEKQVNTHKEIWEMDTECRQNNIVMDRLGVY
ncbi:hypothetical protein XENTR_v10012414 [Xenopus tropicalis]|nr:hypothetical protein XENTR_v10012414 [Xenopus tropicalis]